MPSRDIHPAAEPVERLLAQCSQRRQRRSGPGGQHRNKVETAVVVTHDPTGVSAAASERRSQEQNRRTAVRRLRVNLALQVRAAVHKRAPPSPRWQARCRGGRLDVAGRHADFPALLAEALDTLAAYDLSVSAAAQHLGCSSTQLVKLLKIDSRALLAVNQQRTEQGLPPLR